MQTSQLGSKPPGKNEIPACGEKNKSAPIQQTTFDLAKSRLVRDSIFSAHHRMVGIPLGRGGPVSRRGVDLEFVGNTGRRGGDPGTKRMVETRLPDVGLPFHFAQRCSTRISPPLDDKADGVKV